MIGCIGSICKRHWRNLVSRGSILSAIMALHSTPSAQVNASGLLSKSFNISNVTQQGCRLSPSIVDLMIEPLEEPIHSHQCTQFPQIRPQNKPFFADYIILLLTSPESSLPQVFQILSQFSCISYYKVNASKSLTPYLGVQASTKHTLQSQFPILGGFYHVLLFPIKTTIYPLATSDWILSAPFTYPHKFIRKLP